MTEITEIKNKDINTVLTSQMMASIDKLLSYVESPIESVDFLKNIDFEEMILIIDNMLYDDDIDSALNALKSEMKKALYTLVPADATAEAENNVELIEQIMIPKLSNIIDSLFESLKYGFQMMSLNWEITDGRYKIKSIDNLKAEYFKFTPDNKVYINETFEIDKYTLSSGNVVNIDIAPAKYKLMLHSHAQSKGSLYGESLIIRAYYLWSMKNLDFQQWTLFLKKCAIPSFIALFDATEDQGIINTRSAALAQALMSVKSGTGGAMANVREIVKLEPLGLGSEIFQAMIDNICKRIYKLITGASLFADSGETGSYAMAEIHQATMRDRCKSYMDEFTATINDKIIPAIIDLNTVGSKAYPRINFYWKEVADWSKIKDALAFGIPLKKDVLIEDYKIPIATDEDLDDENYIQVEKQEADIEQNFSKSYGVTFSADTKKKS